MSLTQPTMRSPMARWSRNLAVFSVQLLLVGMILHRLMSLATPVTLNLFLAALAGAALAILLAIGAFVAIWRDGRLGAWSATAGLVLGLMLFAWPAALVPLYRAKPAIHDITTDTMLPPSFVVAAGLRKPDANPVAYAGAGVATLQREAYPDIRPIVVPRAVNEVWEVMGETVRRLRWSVVAETPPEGRGRPGYIEATDRTLILGFYDDVVIRIDGNSRETRIDARSASRYGVHDFGRNAKRIRSLFKEFTTRLDATVTGGDRAGNRRGTARSRVPKRGKAARARGSGRSR